MGSMSMSNIQRSSFDERIKRIHKGGDYTIDEVVGADFVQANGGRVLLAETEAGYSTSGTIEKLQR